MLLDRNLNESIHKPLPIIIISLFYHPLTAPPSVRNRHCIGSCSRQILRILRQLIQHPFLLMRVMKSSFPQKFLLSPRLTIMPTLYQTPFQFRYFKCHPIVSLQLLLPTCTLHTYDSWPICICACVPSLPMPPDHTFAPIGQLK